MRYKLTHDLMRAYGLFDREDVTVVPPPSSRDEDLERVHTRDYIDVVKYLSESPDKIASEAGLGVSDNPVFAGMHEVSAIVAGGSIEAARRVLDGELGYAFNVSGGLHHALPARASGFCIYNDPAITIAWLLSRGVDRIVYIDTDAHHGDGVQWIFYEEPRVMTISIHESGRYLFPGTGDVGETGRGKAKGTSINVPLAPQASDADMLFALDEAALPLAQAFKPDFLVLQHGCDGHRLDPLTHLQYSLNVYPEIARRERDLAQEVAEGRAIGGGGGGYAFRDVVPRAWTCTFAVLSNLDLPEELPVSWRDEAGISATHLTRDEPGPEDPLASTEETVERLLREIKPFQG